MNEFRDTAQVEHLYRIAVNAAAERSPLGHPLPEPELRAIHAAVNAVLAVVNKQAAEVLDAAADELWQESRTEDELVVVGWLRGRAQDHRGTSSAAADGPEPAHAIDHESGEFR